MKAVVGLVFFVITLFSVSSKAASVAELDRVLFYTVTKFGALNEITDEQIKNTIDDLHVQNSDKLKSDICLEKIANYSSNTTILRYSTKILEDFIKAQNIPAMNNIFNTISRASQANVTDYRFLKSDCL